MKELFPYQLEKLDFICSVASIAQLYYPLVTVTREIEWRTSTSLGLLFRGKGGR